MNTKQERPIRLGELSRLIKGRLDGSADIEICGIASIKNASSNDITFLSDAKNYSAHLKSLEYSKACAIIAPEDAPELKIPSIRFKNSYEGFARALEYFYPLKKSDAGIHPAAFVHENAKISKTSIIEPNATVEEGAIIGDGAWICGGCYIGANSEIGKNSIISPNVSILHTCKIGDDCIIHSGTVIGSDGFGFTPVNGRHMKVPQVGNVVVENNVEIGSNTTIDRGTLGSTVIGSGTKIDNLVHIAHNVIIGKNCIIVGQVGISGSTILEDNVTLAGQVGTVGHVTVGKGSTVAARGVVTNNVPENSFVSGFPIKNHSEERRILAATRKLPELLKRVRALEKITNHRK